MLKKISCILAMALITSVLYAGTSSNQSDRKGFFNQTPEEKAKSDRKAEEIRKYCQEHACSISK